MPHDFSNQNLRGRSFKRQDLAGADFRGADIRGTDFSRAMLRQANFTGARAGLQKRFQLLWLFTLCAFTLVVTFASASTNSMTWWRFGSDSFQAYAAWFGVSTAALFTLLLLISLAKNISVCLKTWLGLIMVTGALAGICQVIQLPEANTFYVWVRATVAVLTIGLIISATLTEAIILAHKLMRASRVPTILIVISALAGSVIGAVFRVTVRGGADDLLLQPIWAWTWAWVDFLWILMWVSLLAAIAVYGSWQLLVNREPALVVLEDLAVAIAASSGTQFYGADLSGADFSRAVLSNADLRDADLDRTLWAKAAGLELVRPGTSYLKHPLIRQVVSTRRGNGQRFDSLSLAGVNLESADLRDASFIGADLSRASLRSADLSRTVLKQAQLDAADLSGATLTGAYIEDWGITADTQLDDVQCEYVYMRVPTKDAPDPLRKPDNHQDVFQNGDFADFIRPIIQTLDLYHNQGVDPRAIAISFKKLAEAHPEADLRIMAMEVKGEDKFLLRARTASAANKSALSATYFDTYNQVRSLPEDQVRTLLADQYVRAQRLENMVETALQRPSFYSHVEQVGTMTHDSSHISISSSSGVNIAKGDRNLQGDHNQAAMGDHSQVQQGEAAALTQDEVLGLFAELGELIQRSRLPEAAKDEATTYLKAAKVATKKGKPDAVKANLETMTETLSEASKTVEAGKTFWQTARPIVLKIGAWLGMATFGGL
ncbi:MAG: pentapeptide repeat-containing protein [Elainellaceae cyanobacterium]